MNAPTLIPKLGSDLLYVQLAREIAIDHYDIETILKRYHINAETWSKIQAQPRFTQLLEAEIIAWQAAGNTHERTKLKAAAIVELWLEEATSLLHAKDQPLNSKTELGKLITRIAGMGLERAQINDGNGSERFSVTINLGTEQPEIKIQKDITPKVIDGGML